MATTALKTLVGVAVVAMAAMGALLVATKCLSERSLERYVRQIFRPTSGPGVVSHRPTAFPGQSLVLFRGGLKPWEGMVMWRASSFPLCRQGLSQADADVICRNLFSHSMNQQAVIQDPAGFTDLSQYPTVSLSNFRCHGDEASLDQCPNPTAHDIPSVNCPRGIAVLTCESTDNITDILRLTDGTTPTEGRLEFADNGTWRSICDLSTDTRLSLLEAVPVCKAFGLWYVVPTVATPGEFGAGSDDLLTSVPQCSGDEPDVRYCTMTSLAAQRICNHTQDSGLRCTLATMSKDKLRFVGDSNLPWKGRVSIQEPGSRDTTAVCARMWDANDTAVTCRTAGYKYGGTALTPITSTVSATRTRVERLECKGQEATLAECPGYDVVTSFQCGGPAHTELAAVDCSGGYDVRLVSNDSQKAQGVVEIYKPDTQEWVTVTNGSLDILGAKAACSSIQYPDTDPGLYGDVWGSNNTVSSLNCSGGQDHIAQCVIPSPSVTNVLHAAVRCFRCGTDQPEAAESGDMAILTNNTMGQDCMYVVRPGGPATLYKLWIDGTTLLDGDFIDIRKSPELGPVALAKGPTTGGPFVLFEKEVYIRVKSVNKTGHTATLHWRPVTVETVTTMICTDDDMKIRVNVTELRWLYNDTDPGYISLINEGCTGSAIGDTWMIDNPHSQCYTQREVDADFVHYRNALIYKEKGSGPIVREHRWRVDLHCNFRRQRTVGLDYTVQDVYNYEMNLKSDYEAAIHLYNDSSLRTELTGGQVRARLGDDLYVLVELKGDWNVTMHIQDCVARPEPTSSVEYNLIQNGCASDSETFIVYASHNETLFHFKAFEFYAGFSSVYVFCDVIYCAPMDANPKCDRDC